MVPWHFGEDVYTNDQLNRQHLAEIVFNNPEKLELLNALVHPPTIKDAEQWMSRQTTPYVVKEAALLFESGSAASLDYVIGVRAPVEIRIKRTMDRDGFSREEVMKRMDRQIDEDMKMRLCDFIINNDEQELIIPQVISLHTSFLAMADEK